MVTRLLLLVLLCVSAQAQFLFRKSAAFESVSAAPAATYLLEQNCDDGTGWTDTANVTWGSTAVDMGKGDVVQIDTATADRTTTSPTYTEPATLYGYFIFRMTYDTPTSDPTFLGIRDGSSLLARVTMSSSTKRLKLYHGTVNSSTATWTLAANVTYHIWFEYTKATGAGNDGVMKVGLSTDGTKPSLETLITTGTSTTTSDRIRLYADYTDAALTCYFDRILLDDVAIGSNP